MNTNTKKSLQKLTESEIKVNNLLHQNKINKEDVDKLNDDELRLLTATLNKKLNELERS